jgi:hypothetical protein
MMPKRPKHLQNMLTELSLEEFENQIRKNIDNTKSSEELRTKVRSIRQQ